MDPATEDALLRPGLGRVLVLRLAEDPKKEETLGTENIMMAQLSHDGLYLEEASRGEARADSGPAGSGLKI